MARSVRAFVNPAVLRWARESTGYGIAESAKRAGIQGDVLEQAESGDHHLTLRQAEALARFYERPFAVLFLKEPPHEEELETRFRRFPGTPPLPWPPKLISLTRRVGERQTQAADLYQVLGETPLWGQSSFLYTGGTAEQAASSARARLRISLEAQKSWRDRDGYKPLRAWITAAEQLGVLVMQNGDVPPEEMRGFSSPHRDVPVVVLNTKDHPCARAFTVLHELGHLLRTRTGVQSESRDEEWCNEFAGSVLMPLESFRVDLENEWKHSPGIDAIDEVARQYGVTSQAAAVRASRRRIIAESDIDRVFQIIKSREQRRKQKQTEKSQGGDPNRNTVARLGPGFISLIFDALDQDMVSDSTASRLLEAKIDRFEGIRGAIEERAALGDRF
ncbi:MAG: XRE family transcriptional regulator [Actinomycetia bacterium]|nr:XRE family transcriptional regulator [Actinomycetes bacterium]